MTDEQARATVLSQEQELAKILHEITGIFANRFKEYPSELEGEDTPEKQAALDQAIDYQKDNIRAAAGIQCMLGSVADKIG